MTKNSVLCNFINEHKENWRELLSSEPYYITIKNDGNLYMFNYADSRKLEDIARAKAIENGEEEIEWLHTDFSLPEVQESRGIVLEVVDGDANVVCWPFRKFGNYGESYVDNIDWNSASVQTKVDGSIMKVWFDKREEENRWRVSTNSTINAYDNKNGLYVNFGEIFDEAAKGVLDYSILNKDYTYIFELVSPKTRVVIDYPETKIYHLGTRSNITGQELLTDIGVEKPKEYYLNNLNDCIKAAQMLNNAKEESDRFNVEYEGFVVCDKNFNRIKIKSPEYLTAHNALNNGILSYARTIEIIENNEIEEYGTYFPQHLDKLKEYEKKYYEVINNIEKYINYATKLFNTKAHQDMKEVAQIIKNDRYATFAFSVLKSNKEISARELFAALHLKNKRSFIPSRR